MAWLHDTARHVSMVTSPVLSSVFWPCLLSIPLSCGFLLVGMVHRYALNFDSILSVSLSDYFRLHSILVASDLSFGPQNVAICTGQERNRPVAELTQIHTHG